MGEVQLGLSARGMLLGKVDLLVRAIQGPPVLQSPLQGAQLRGADPAGEFLLQPLDNCRCPEPAGGLALEQGQDLLLPDPVEGIGAGPPPCRPVLVSDGNGPCCHFRAERSLIPAIAAAVCCVFPFHSSLPQYCDLLIRKPIRHLLYRMITHWDRQK